ncbi:unnamed protein product, partial [Hapterophycus canaliculatus]
LSCIILFGAADRMGGRIFTHEESRSRNDQNDQNEGITRSRPLELGAQWLHGTVGNPLFEFCMEEGIFDSQGVVLRVEVKSISFRYARGAV